jgi:amino acid transporter
MSGAINSTPPAYPAGDDKFSSEKEAGASPVLADDLNASSFHNGTKKDATHRRLKSRHIQLIGIGGTIGTALYVRRYQSFSLA